MTDREQKILSYVIQQFILNANPVGSRILSKNSELGLSPASIRNIMADLEDLGFLDHPHTSAGRIPTDKGYRYYVDNLMQIAQLQNRQKEELHQTIESQVSYNQELLSITSQILSKVTNLIAYVTYPKLEVAILERIQLVQITSTRLLIVISVKNGPVKTLTFEIENIVRTEKLYYLESILNEKLDGLTFSEINHTLVDRLKESVDISDSIIRIFVDYPDKIFNAETNDIYIAGRQNVLSQPEFENNELVKGVIELVQDKSIIVHVLDNVKDIENKVMFSIGTENDIETLHSYSVVLKKYSTKNMIGKIGLVGPKRMDYSKVVAIVDYVAELLSAKIKPQ